MYQISNEYYTLFSTSPNCDVVLSGSLTYNLRAGQAEKHLEEPRTLVLDRRKDHEKRKKGRPLPERSLEEVEKITPPSPPPRLASSSLATLPPPRGRVFLPGRARGGKAGQSKDLERA
jgi:hypothetical protein